MPALKGPPSPRSAPRVGVPLSRGAERGRPGQRQVWEGHLPWLSDCPRQAVSPPHPGRGWVRTPGGGRLGAPHQRARGRAGFARSMCEPLQRDTPLSLPKTCCVITPRSRGSPQKQMGGVFPYLSAGPGEPRRAGVLYSARFLLPCPAAETSSGRSRGRCGGAGLCRGDPAAGESRTPRAVFICRKKGNLSAYTKNQGC